MYVSYEYMDIYRAIWKTLAKLHEHTLLYSIGELSLCNERKEFLLNY